MKKRSFVLLAGLLIVAMLCVALAACNNSVTYELSDTSVSLKIGETKQLTVTPETDEITWDSDRKDVATVENGLVKAVGVGTANVTAAIVGEDQTLTCVVTVTAEEVGGYSFEVASLSLKTGEKHQLKIIDKDGHSPSSVTYTSDDPTIASVSATGLVEAKNVGNTNIKAQIPGGTLTCTVQVAQKYTYSLDKTALDLAVGASETLTLVTNPAGGTSRPHTFTSSDPTIATVDGGNGKVTGVGKGTATITCSVDGEEVTASVTVREYTIKIGTEAFVNGMEISLNEEYDVSITADPTLANISAAYKTSDATTIAVDAQGHVIPQKVGSATITVTVGGKDFSALVTVKSSYSINEESATLVYGKTGENTVQLTVSDGSNPLTSGVTFESSDEQVVSVGSTSGLVTATGVGTATITATVSEEVFFEVEVTVKYGVEKNEIDYPSDDDKATVNLDAPDGTYKALDWHYYGKENYVEKKKNGQLISDYEGTKDSDFYDYRVRMTWIDGTTTATSSSGRVDGITFKQDVSFTVKVTSDVKYVAIFTGAWHATNTVSISYNGVECASTTFTNHGNGIDKNKQIIFTPDVAHLIDGEMEFTITLGFQGDGDGANNVSLVAIAVVGNEVREAASATAQTPVVTTPGSATINLSELGNVDWAYSSNGGGNKIARKAGVTGVIGDVSNIQYVGGQGNGNDTLAAGKFNWYTADANAATVGGSTNNFVWANESYSIPVHLGTGTYTVTLYLSGWKNSYFVSVYDGQGNAIVDKALAAQGDGNSSKGVAVAITLTVTKEDDFAFTMTKSGDGNHGWGAIAVSQETTFALTKYEYNLEIGVKDNDKIDVSEDSNVTFESNDERVATVTNQGDITAVGMGSTYITITDSNNVSRRVFVNVAKGIEASAKLEELQWDIENLTRASSEYKTIDYAHWHNGGTTSMPGGAGLIGEPNGTHGNFWDYKGSIGYEFSETGNRNLGMSYGKTAATANVEVKISNAVSGIVFYTGAYNATGTISFKIGDKVIAQPVTFAASDDGIARKVVLTLDTDDLTSEPTVTIEAKASNIGNNGNVNVNAVAVIGKVAQDVASATGTADRQRIEGDAGSESNKVDLTEEGTLDWIYSQYDNNAGYQKFGGTVFGEKKYTGFNDPREGEQLEARPNGGNEWDGRKGFKWSNGMLIGSDAQEGSANPADVNNESWDGHDQYTNNYKTSNREIHIGMSLTEGTYTIKLYLNSWKADLAAGIYDGNGNFIVGKVCLSNEPGDGSGWVVTFTINVTKADNFTLVIGKVRSHDANDRQVGWQAVTIAKIEE